MHRKKGVARGNTGVGQGTCRSSPTAVQRAQRGTARSPRSPTVPIAAQVGTRSSPRVAAVAAAAVASRQDTDDAEDRLGESQPLLSPPARDVAPSYLCDWAQATQCLLTSLKPEPCQREGCNVLVHRLCQGE